MTQFFYTCTCGRKHVIEIGEIQVQEIKSEAQKTYKIAPNPCKRCGGRISWDGYDKETRPYPLHVDEFGHEVESCYKEE